MPSTVRSPLQHVSPTSTPERWETDAGDADVARLNIPDDPRRDRTFEVSCSFTVAPIGTGESTHGLRLLVNGAQEWSRDVRTHAGERDSLDYRFKRTLPAGQPLRVNATTSVKGCKRVRLLISAEETSAEET